MTTSLLHDGITIMKRLFSSSHSARVWINIVGAAAALTTVVACGSADSTGPAPSGGGDAYIRYVNGAYKEISSGPTTATVVVSGTNTITTQQTSVTYEQVPIDFLIDSSANTPSVMGLGPSSRSTGSVGQEPANLASGGYRPVSRGVRGFVARQSGLTPTPGYSFFTTSASAGIQEYVPKQYLTAKTYYTLGVAGIVAASQEDGSQTINPPQNIVFNLATDNPFAPPSIVVGGKEEYMARFQVYNFATWGGVNSAATDWQIYLTPGSTPPGSYQYLDATGNVPSYTNLSSFRRYTNASGGSYYLSIVSRDGINLNLVWGTAVTLKPGEIHSYIIVNDMPQFTVTRTRRIRVNSAGTVTSDITSVVTPTAPTFKVIDVIDNQY